MHPLGATHHAVAATRQDARAKGFTNGESIATTECVARSNRRAGVQTSDALQVPNRPLKRGENLLDLWDRTQARQDKKPTSKTTQASKRSGKLKEEEAVAPQRLNQWLSQIHQNDSFCSFLES